MSGIIVPILDRRRLDYSFLPGSDQQSITLNPAFPTCDYLHAFLFVRVHSRAMTGGQSIVFSAFHALPSDEDPQEFVDESSSLADVTITDSVPTVVPGISYRELATPGPFLKFVLLARQTSVQSQFYAELSAVVVFRER
jgi:hypothetical protein